MPPRPRNIAIRAARERGITGTPFRVVNGYNGRIVDDEAA